MWILVTLLVLTTLDARAAPCQGSEDLLAVFVADQGDRETDTIDWLHVGPRDRARRAKVTALLEDREALCAEDLYRAAMVYQHGHSPDHYLLAHVLATAAAIGGHPPARRLAASTLDRFLHRIGRPQVLGTQLHKYPGESEFSPEPYDRDFVPRTVRESFDVPTPAEQEARLVELNR